MAQSGLDGWLKTPYNLSGKRVWVAGHNGMVGAAVAQRLKSEDCEILTVGRDRLDLCDQRATCEWITANNPDVVVIAAAKVGGILANDTYPADFLYDNLMIGANIIHAAHEAGVEKLLFLGSSCVYPKEAAQPIGESALLSGPLEPTNEAYAVAKIAGIKLCEAYRKQHGCDFISVMPCNLYGPGDTFDAQNSHVIPALMMKAHEAKENEAKEIVLWGSGQPLREFLYVDDLADAVVFALQNYSDVQPLNIGFGEDISIAALAETVAEVVGFKGELVYDAGKPDGIFRKLMDSSRIRNAGWQPRISLKEGLTQSYAWYLEKNKSIKKAVS